MDANTNDQKFYLSILIEQKRTNELLEKLLSLYPIAKDTEKKEEQDGNKLRQRRKSPKV